MKKSFRYRLYPTKKQQRHLNEWLALCCEVYNAALDERKSAYRMAGRSLGYSHQCAELPACKDVRPELAQVNSQVLQDVVKRVDRAFEGFFRRVAAGQQAARRLVNQYGLIALEALSVRNLIKNPKLAQSIADAAWSAFVRVLLDKAAEADRTVIRVNPAYTSQTCSACGHRQEMPLSVRIWECDRCSLMLDRDHNASLNILAQAVGRHGHVIQEAPALEAWGVVTGKL